MKVAILAGGYGTRLSEETDLRPKPMIEIGGKPMLWHIMRHYHHYGFNEFVILAGYKSYLIKEYFMHYHAHNRDFTVDTRSGEMNFLSDAAEDWKVTVLDTGIDTMTGGRILRAQKHLQEAPFLLTYGDGVSDVNLLKLLEFHQQSKATVTLTALQPQGRFGVIEFGPKDRIARFAEKQQGEGAWINAGFMVCTPDVFATLDKGDETIFERSPLEKLASQNKLFAYRHTGFWQCMDTLRDKTQLQSMWNEGRVAWQI